ncbi:origin recognition complex subunit 1 isoform X2 [Calliopsis andreniformis]|uniref:origin recognition complex subunit 1 isoform X2 n=1 Tax=Calliopsis andreniformis TaxID=337506 RepID=UPI003FCD9693
MSTRANKCLEHQIVALLDEQSDSDTQKDETVVNKVQIRKSTKSQNRGTTFVNVDSDEENIVRNSKYQLPKKNSFKDEKVSLRIKLRRSTEQSLYKIDTDSECEKPMRKSRSRLLKQRKKSHSEVESEESTDKDSAGKIKINDKEKAEQTEKGNGELTRTRIRKPPLRFSSYHCTTIPSLNHSNNSINSPSLRSRKNINYNEDKLFINSVITNVKAIKTQQKENKDINVHTVKGDSEPKTPESSIKNIKRNRIPSMKDTENDSGTDSKAVKVKSMKISNNKLIDSPKAKNIVQKQDLSNTTPVKMNKQLIKIANNKLINSPKAKNALQEQDVSNGTSVKMNKQKRALSESVQKDVPLANKNKDGIEEDCLVDMYKDIKISSPTTNTPIKKDKQKINSETAEKNIQDVDHNDSNDEEFLADMYKRIKISSAKKNTPQRRNNTRKSIHLRLEETLLSTPKSRLTKRNFTPSMGKRHSTLLKPATPLQEARSRLHVSAVPKSLPCREEEFNTIFTFLNKRLEDKSGGCIYISGVPGTGKTATVNEAVKCLQKLIMKGQLEDFNYVAINGMKITEPRQSYVQILKQLDGKTFTWEQAYRILEKRFHTANSKMTLLLVDELDFLCTKRQDVVYNLLDWPTKAMSKLVVVTIANTMDLPERVLMGRVTSRLGLTRLTFQPYNYKQLQEIVMSRLKDFDGFRSEAVQLVARNSIVGKFPLYLEMRDELWTYVAARWKLQNHGTLK